VPRSQSWIFQTSSGVEPVASRSLAVRIPNPSFDTTSEEWNTPVRSVEPDTGSRSVFKRPGAPLYTHYLGCVVVMEIYDYLRLHLRLNCSNSCSQHRRLKRSTSVRTSGNTILPSPSHLSGPKLMTALTEAAVDPRSSRSTGNYTITLVLYSLLTNAHPSMPSSTSSTLAQHRTTECEEMVVLTQT